MIADNHNHLVANGNPAAMLAAAAEVGIDEFAFTEHIFHFEEALREIPYLATRWPFEGEPRSHASYMHDAREAAYGSSVKVRIGVELDARHDHPEFEALVAAFRASYGAQWDLVLGSVHVIKDDLDVQDDPLPMSADAAWNDYFDRLEGCATSGLYDVVSHPARLGVSTPTAPAFLAERYDALAALAAKHGVALEVNGSDWKRSPHLVTELIAAIARQKTLVSIGSDAHSTRTIGSGLGALEALKAAGIRSCVSFERRVSRERPLPR